MITSIAPPPPPSRDNFHHHAFSTLPPGWTTAINELDGRVYYWEVESGRTSWFHPYSTQADCMPDASTYPSHVAIMESNQLPNRSYGSEVVPGRPDSNQFYAFVSFWFCPLIGIIALIHSLKADRAWDQGRYSNAVRHAREVPKYATFGLCVGIWFWVYWLFGLDWTGIKFEK